MLAALLYVVKKSEIMEKGIIKYIVICVVNYLMELKRAVYLKRLVYSN